MLGLESGSGIGSNEHALFDVAYSYTLYLTAQVIQVLLGRLLIGSQIQVYQTSNLKQTLLLSTVNLLNLDTVLSSSIPQVPKPSQNQHIQLAPALVAQQTPTSPSSAVTIPLGQVHPVTPHPCSQHCLRFVGTPGPPDGDLVDEFDEGVAVQLGVVPVGAQHQVELVVQQAPRAHGLQAGRALAVVAPVREIYAAGQVGAGVRLGAIKGCYKLLRLHSKITL